MTKNLSLAFWREMGPITATRYPDLYVWKQDIGLWRHLANFGDGEHDVTLDQFKTKDEAFAALPATAERLWGVETDPTPTRLVLDETFTFDPEGDGMPWPLPRREEHSTYTPPVPQEVTEARIGATLAHILGAEFSTEDQRFIQGVNLPADSSATLSDTGRALLLTVLDPTGANGVREFTVTVKAVEA